MTFEIRPIALRSIYASSLILAALFFLINAITARTNTIALSETVIDVKLMPMGDNPRNKPSKPAKPKLKATDKTISSTKSSLFLPRKSTFTKQYPGKKAIKTKTKK